MRRGRSMSTSKLAVTRPGRGDITTIRSPRRAASRTLWVTNSTVSSARRGRGRRAPRGGCRGSSRRGRRTARPSAGRRRPGRSARASAPRWRMPPDSWCGRFLANAAEVHGLEQLRRPLPALGLAARRPAHRQLDVRLRPSATGTAPPPGTSAPVAPCTSTVPARRLVEAGDEVEDRRLAAAGRADEAHELARRDLEVDVGERGDGVAPVPNVLATPRSESDAHDA